MIFTFDICHIHTEDGWISDKYDDSISGAVSKHFHGFVNKINYNTSLYFTTSVCSRAIAQLRPDDIFIVQKDGLNDDSVF